MYFTNEVIPEENLPRFESVDMTPVDPLYRKIILWNWVIMALFFAAAVSAFFFAPELAGYRVAAVVIAVIFVLTWGLLQLKAFERRSYAIRDHDLIYRHGILSISTTVIPYKRIQHVAVREGILSRRYGLAVIQIFTAGGSAADLQIPGLSKHNAESLRELILEKIR